MGPTSPIEALVHRDFDPGYPDDPFSSLCRGYPVEPTYPRADFRVEWGPVFHRGRLDGSARVLVIGQDPSPQDAVVRRCLVGLAGHRIQGFLNRLGITRSYVMINAFLYSLCDQARGEKHRRNAGIIAYRHRWLDALLSGSGITAVLALGELADEAWERYRQTPTGRSFPVAYRHLVHPTQPESAGKGNVARMRHLTTRLLQNWNEAMLAIRPALGQPDTYRALLPYGTRFVPGDLCEIPERDLPPGLPAWMRGSAGWAERTGMGLARRKTLTIRIPRQGEPAPAPRRNSA